MDRDGGAHLRSGRPRDAGAEGGDMAHHLVAEHQGLAHREVAHPAPVVVVQIGTADPAEGDGDRDLPGCGTVVRPFLDPEVADSVDNTRAHGDSLRGRQGHRTDSMPPSTYSSCPLTKSEAGEERKSRAPTRSSTLPQRPAGVRPRTQALNSSSATSAEVSSVSK